MLTEETLKDFDAIAKAAFEAKVQIKALKQKVEGELAEFMHTVLDDLQDAICVNNINK